jgi:sec-independent protein translocase protein TatC
MSNGQPFNDPEDMFADTRMSFGDHLEELRTYLWRAVYGFGVAMILAIFVAYPVLRFIAAPVERQLDIFYQKRAERAIADAKAKQGEALGNAPTAFVRMAFVREQLQMVADKRPTADGNAFPRPIVGKQGESDPGGAGGWWTRVFGGGNPEAAAPGEEVKYIGDDDLVFLWMRHQEPLREVAGMSEAMRQVGRRPVLSTLSIQEVVVVYFKVALVTGFVIGSPWIFWQIWMFIAAGLYPHEKRLVNVYLPISLSLFFLGVIICQFGVMPEAIKALLWFNELLDFEPDLRLNEWLGFAIMMPLIFGLSFQTPLVMLFLERVGILSIEQYRQHRRLAIFLLAVFAALITPSVDPISLLLMWVPLTLLFEMGIWLCSLAPRAPDFDTDVPDSEEIVEV